MEWLKLLKGFKPKKYFLQRCPICADGSRLADIGGGNGRCARGHMFGPDAPRDPSALEIGKGPTPGDI